MITSYILYKHLPIVFLNYVTSRSGIHGLWLRRTLVRLNNLLSFYRSGDLCFVLYGSLETIYHLFTIYVVILSPQRPSNLYAQLMKHCGSVSIITIRIIFTNGTGISFANTNLWKHNAEKSETNLLIAAKVRNVEVSDATKAAQHYKAGTKFSSGIYFFCLLSRFSIA